MHWNTVEIYTLGIGVSALLSLQKLRAFLTKT